MPGIMLIEGSFKVKLPTIWTDEKQRWEESEKRREEERERVRRKELQVREKVRESRNTLFFPMICGSGGSKSRLAKAAGAEPSGQMRDEKLHTVAARSTFPSHFFKIQVRTTFGSCDVKKVHAVVVRSTFASEKVKHTSRSDHCWKLRCRTSARRCGTKHICKSKCTKHTMSGPLLEVEMSKKCTPLWREAHFEVKMYKAPEARTTFGRSDVVSRGRRKGLCTFSKVSKTWGL